MVSEKFERELPPASEQIEKVENASKEEKIEEISDKKVNKKTLKIEEMAKTSVAQKKLSSTDEEAIIIKSVLSENISGIYGQLSNLRKSAFRNKGEEVAVKIKKILQSPRVRAHEIFELIKNWLMMLPKISLYFLEQEAKIKTDKILELKREGQIIEK